MMYKVTIRFDRLNVNGKKESSEREGVFSAKSKSDAKREYLARFKKNEPNRRKIHSVTVVEVGSE